jgi:hypothetical protein
MGAQYFDHVSEVEPWSLATHRLSSHSEEITSRVAPKAARKPFMVALQPAGVSIFPIEARATPA